MVSIPEDVKKMIREQQVIIVGTADHTGLTNISPRSTFHVRDDEIYWFELFKHKSYYNFKQNPWVSVAIFDTKKLSGYQMKGNVSVVDDKSESYRIRLGHPTSGQCKRVLSGPRLSMSWPYPVPGQLPAVCEM